MEKTQREYYLNEQLKAIQKDLARARTAPTKTAESKTRSRRPGCRRKRAKKRWRS